MANKLRRWVRRSGFFLSTSSAAAAHIATDHTAPAQKTQGLSHDLEGLVRPSFNSSRPFSFQGRGHCLSASYSASPTSSADEREYNNQEEQLQEIGFMTAKKTVMQSPHQLGRSHSCSTLQSGRQLVPSFIKSLLHIHTSSHTHLNHSRHSPRYNGPGEQPAAEHSSTDARSSRYSRSWSSPSLHIRRHMIKLPQKARSFPRRGSAEQGSASGSGKRVPKGHVAVYVEAGRERRVVPIAYLSHPEFQVLLERAQSEFGFRQRGGLLIPCSLSELQHTLRRIHCDTSPSCI